MNILNHIKSIRPLYLYSVSVFVLALVSLLLLYFNEFTIYSYPILFGAIFSLLFIWQFGIRVPYIGVISMERLVQFYLLLTLPLLDVIIISMCAAFAMPFLDKKYRYDSYKVAFFRGINNAAMDVFMLLVGGYLLHLYIEIPILLLDLKSVLAILLVAIVIQFINIGMIAIYQTIDNKNFKKLLNPTFILADLIFVPGGVLLALLHQNSNQNIFWLFIFFIVIILLSFKLLQSENQSSEFTFKGTDYKSDYLDINSVCFAIMRRLSQLFKYECVYLGSFNKDLQVLELYIKYLKNKQDIISESGLIKISQNKKLNNRIIEYKSNNGKFQKFAILTAPFKNQDGFFAFICLVKKSQVEFSETDVKLFELMIHRYEMGLSYAINYKNLSEYKNTLELRVNKRTKALKEVNDEKTKLMNELKSMAQRDGLTGLFNRRYFDNLLDNYQTKKPEKLSLAIIDIDFFKTVNDDFGHQVGDDVLKKLAEIFTTEIKKGMDVARYGGEEFVILIKNSNMKDVNYFCQRLLKSVSNYKWSEISKNLNITISIGLSHYPDFKIKNLFHQADKNLYMAKTSGRNQIQPPVLVSEDVL